MVFIGRAEGHPNQMTDGYHIRRTSVDFSVGLITNIKCAVLLVGALIRVGIVMRNPADMPLTYNRLRDST